jgi:hypothetical protein
MFFYFNFFAKKKIDKKDILKVGKIEIRRNNIVTVKIIFKTFFLI